MTATACHGNEAPTAASSPASSVPFLFLVPDSSPATAQQPARFWFSRGDLSDGAAMGQVEERFDPFVARVGGFQHNELQVDVSSGRASVSHAFEAPGDAMIAFSTVPRLVERDDDGSREQILLAQSVKCLRRVIAVGGDESPPSSALTARVGLPFEIVPVIDPLPLRAGDMLPLQVGEEEEGDAEPITVRVQRLPPGGASVIEHFRGTADDEGTVVVPIGDPGRYLIIAEHETETEGEVTRVDRATLCFDLEANR